MVPRIFSLTHFFPVEDLQFPTIAPLRARYEALLAMRELIESRRFKYITLVFIYSTDEHIFAVAHELELLGLSPIVNYSDLSPAELQSLSPDERSAEIANVKVCITRGSFYAKVL